MTTAEIPNKKRRTLYDVIMYAILVVFTALVGFLSFGQGFDPNVLPDLAGGDSNNGLMLIRSIQENGLMGLYYNPRIGAPDTSSLIDWPVTDPILGFIWFLLSLCIQSTAGVLYGSFVVSFPLNALPLAVLLRKLNVKREISFIIAALFTFAPYHFLRSINHLTLSFYPCFAFAIYLALVILGVFSDERRWKIILSCVIVGFSNGYYYAFSLILLAMALIMRAIRDRSLRSALRLAWIPVTVLVAVVFSFLPQIVHWIVAGRNAASGARLPIEQEIYGLKIIQLLFPPTYSRIPIFARLTQKYTSMAPLVNENATAALGLVAAIGFIGLCVALIYSFVAKDRCQGKTWLIVDFLALSTVTLVLLSSIGGFGELISWFVTAQIRCYNRSSIFISGLSLTLVALALNKVDFRKRSLSCIVCTVILAVSMFDTVLIQPKDYQDSAKAAQPTYEQFFHEVEGALEEGAMVYQLPYLDFPESGEYDYAHFKAPVLTDTLRWSYGGVRGRDLTAKQLLSNNGQSMHFLKNISDAGFSAVYIDRAGYEDDGNAALDFYMSLGIEPIVSADGMLYLFDIRGMDIPEAESKAGYHFVSSWYDMCAKDISADQCSSLASQLEANNRSAYDDLFTMAETAGVFSGYTDDEFVRFLFSTLFERSANDAEVQEWVKKLEESISREDMFLTFIGLDEFRQAQGFDPLE